MLLAFPTLAALAQLTIGGGGGQVQQTEYIYRPVRGRHGGGGGNPFGGLVPGALIMAGSSALLWWNEGRSARDEQMLSAARREVRSLDASRPLRLGDDVDDAYPTRLQGIVRVTDTIAPTISLLPITSL